MKTATILPAMKSPDDKLGPIARKGPRPEPASSPWRRLFEPIASGPRQLLLASSPRPGWLAHSWRALAIAALVGVGGMALVNDLLDLGERQAVLAFFDECDVFWTTGRDRLAQWRKSVQAGQKPDFGSGFHFRFKRLKP